MVVTDGLVTILVLDVVVDVTELPLEPPLNIRNEPPIKTARSTTTAAKLPLRKVKSCHPYLSSITLLMQVEIKPHDAS